VETLDASASTGGVSATVPDTDFTFTGGTGDDSIEFNDGNFDDNDTADGGDGDDTLGMSSGDAQDITTTGDALTTVSNFEKLSVFNTVTGDIDVTLFNLNAEFVSQDGFGAASTITLLSGGVFTVESGSGDGGNSVTLLIEGEGLSDTLDVNVGDASFTGTTLFDGIETVNMTVADGSVFFSLVQMDPSNPAGPNIGDAALNISGDQALQDCAGSWRLSCSTICGFGIDAP
jgi:hypothetical protein